MHLHTRNQGICAASSKTAQQVTRAYEASSFSMTGERARLGCARSQAKNKKRAYLVQKIRIRVRTRT
jgi:hypothetical protein